MESIPDARQLSFDDPKLCECGCGQPAPISRNTDKRYGTVRGQPSRFVHGHQSTRSLEPRFWAKVDKSGGPDACWEWQGSRNPDGYGNFGRRPYGSVRAHRMAYELAHGAIPPGKSVLHRCDNPPCCNPAHLFLGTQLDNIADRHAKGRSSGPRGEQHGEHKYSEAVVREAKALFRAGWKRHAIADHLGIKYATLKGILSGRAWKHIE